MASYLMGGDLDEEKARRSILVSNIPENVTYKDVIIYFQRERNGGGEVDSARHVNSRDPSVVVVTFDETETVESAISRPHKLQGSDVTVQRYPMPVVIPEVFEIVHARVNTRIFSSDKILSNVVGILQSDFGIEMRWSGSSDSFVLKGTFQQITLCHDYILDAISRQDQDSLAHPVAAVREKNASKISSSPKDPKAEEIYRTEPIILKFIFTVRKYRDQLLQIQEDNDVEIHGSNDGYNVIIRALPSCTREKFEDGCEKFIGLYKTLFHESSMMSKEVELRQGENSQHLSTKKAVDEIQQRAPVIIEQMTAPDTWLFYGEQNEVKKAIEDVCKLLSIHNPLKRAVRTHIDDSKPEGAHSTEKPVNDNATSLPQPAIHDDKESPTGSDPSQVEEFLTKKGYRMSVKLGDITEEQVDVIVNCNDELLNGFSSGLPKVIVDKGGKDIQLIVESQMKRKKIQPGNIIETEGGSLRCSKLMHIITSAQSKKREISKFIKDACFNCLRKTHCNKLHSIAFPAVGAGNTGLTLKQCLTAMINAVEEYMKTGDTRTNHVKDIRFVHLDPVAFNVFKEELIKRYGDCRIKPKDRRSQTSSISEDNAASYRHRHQGDISVDDSTHKDEQEEKDRCPICLEHFTDSVYLEKCKHQFCRACIEAAFKHKMKCPTCGVAYGMQTGNMPQGTMHDRAYTYRNLPGYERCGLIEIEYHFPSGVQGQNHPNPGQRYTGTSRVAYLPDCREGREVLGLLRKAFDARLTFTIGTSVTTGATNTVTWNDIHHKTAIYGGPTAFGYPDPGYLKRVKEELAAKGIS